MLNLWGVCEIGEISHDPLRKWDFGCTQFRPCRIKREEAAERCCANCVYWLPFDERIAPGEDLDD
jgi:hypothetical protein